MILRAELRRPRAEFAQMEAHVARGAQNTISQYWVVSSADGLRALEADAFGQPLTALGVAADLGPLLLKRGGVSGEIDGARAAAAAWLRTLLSERLRALAALAHLFSQRPCRPPNADTAPEDDAPPEPPRPAERAPEEAAAEAAEAAATTAEAAEGEGLTGGRKLSGTEVARVDSGSLLGWRRSRPHRPSRTGSRRSSGDSDQLEDLRREFDAAAATAEPVIVVTAEAPTEAEADGAAAAAAARRPRRRRGRRRRRRRRSSTPRARRRRCRRRRRLTRRGWRRRRSSAPTWRRRRGWWG